jgi:FkbM family methyltransferase
MIFKSWGETLTRDLDYLGSKLRRITMDAFNDQRMLLSGTRVKTIFDIGANIGKVTAKYSSLFPEATIYSFEPLPESLHKLRRRFEGNSLVKPIQFAVSDKAGKKKFYINQNSATSSLLLTTDSAEYWVEPNAIKNITTIEVAVTTIDDFCKQESIDEIQILKLDIQGGELMALEGAIKKLKQGSILLIYTELLFVPIYEGEALFYEICNFLSGCGYTLFNMYNFYQTRSGQIKWADAIFISPQISF